MLEELVRRVGDRDLHFWSTHAGAQLDFVLARPRAPLGFEVKWADAPAMTRSMRIALDDLKLKALFVVYPGPKRYTLQKRVEVVPVSALDDLLD